MQIISEEKEKMREKKYPAYNFLGHVQHYEKFLKLTSAF